MANIGSMADIQNLFKETISESMENGLRAELDDELGCSKYDCKNKGAAQITVAMVTVARRYTSALVVWMFLFPGLERENSSPRY